MNTIVLIIIDITGVVDLITEFLLHFITAL